MGLGLLLLRIGLFAVLVVVGIRWLGRRLVLRGINDENRMVLAVLVALFLASLGAELAGENCRCLPGWPGREFGAAGGTGEGERIFVGGVLFIPIFFIDLGLLLDAGVRGQPQQLPVHRPDAGGGHRRQRSGLLISGALFGYRRPQILMMWSLTMPKVAATLATAFIGFQAGLLNQTVLNAVLAVMVVTATRTDPDGAFGHPSERGVRARSRQLRGGGFRSRWGQRSGATATRIVVPVANPSNEQGLITMASRLLQAPPVATVCGRPWRW